DVGCFATVTMPTRDYDRVRESLGLFIVLRGHERAELERVVEGAEAYVVIEKADVMRLHRAGTRTAELLDRSGAASTRRHMTDSTRALILASALANTLLETLRDVGDHVVDA